MTAKPQPKAKKGKDVLNLSNFSLEELNALVAAEKLRREDECLAECERIAQSHGFTLADLYRKSTRASRKHLNKPGAVNSVILEVANSGGSVKDVQKRLGWSAKGDIYSRAKKLGLSVRNGAIVAA